MLSAAAIALLTHDRSSSILAGASRPRLLNPVEGAWVRTGHDARLPSRAEGLLLSALCGFVLLVACLGSLSPVDAFVAGLAYAVRAGSSENPLTTCLTRGAPYFAFGIVVLGVAIAWRRRAGGPEIFRVLLALGIGLLMFQGCRLVFERYRPGGPFVHPTPNSFPSGHVANAVLCVVAAVELIGLRGSTRDRVRGALFVGGTLFVAGVAVTRLYFGLHWLSDVVASLVFGAGFAAALAVGRRGSAGHRSPILVTLTLLYLAAVCHLHVCLPSPSADPGRAARARLPVPPIEVEPPAEPVTVAS